MSRAAAKGQPVAQYDLGALYADGRGVRPDPVQAFQWFGAAALRGNRRAMHFLAIAYAEGIGTTKNLPEAARWFERSATLGAVNSQFNLAVLYERGAFDLVKVGDLNRVGSDARLAHCLLHLRHCEEGLRGLA